MVKKGVPDWLNSSLWASDPDQDERLLRYAPKPPEPPPPPPPPPEVPAVREPPAVKEPPSRDDDREETSGSVSPEDVSRQAQLLAELSRKVVNLKEVRRLAAQGIQNGAGIRFTVSKLLLGYLPINRDLWSSELNKKRSQYAVFKAEVLLSCDN